MNMGKLLLVGIFEDLMVLPHLKWIPGYSDARKHQNKIKTADYP